MSGIFLAGCAASKQDLRQSQNTRTEYFDQNYQALYKTVLDQMQTCWHTGLMMPLSPVRMQIKSELYPDLGLGEISYYQSNLGDIHYHLVEVRKKGDGSELTVFTGRKLAHVNQRELETYFAWARGSKSCE
jgi:hypothetical protein